VTNSRVHPESVVIDRRSFLRLEDVGMREKNWLKLNGIDHMFKENLRFTGEDWAEVLAARICSVLQIPHASYKYAHSTNRNGEKVNGVLTESIVGTNQNLTLANELLLAKNPAYPLNTQRFYKTSEHCLTAISNALESLEPPVETYFTTYSTKEHFAGYLFLDSIIGNQDRHHQNWGAIVINENSYLAPTFDHALFWSSTLGHFS
jgi:hypothetical protein